MAYLFYDILYKDKIYTLDFTQSNLLLGNKHCVCQGCFNHDDKLYIRLALDRSEIVNCEILKRYNFNEDTIETKNAYWDEFFRYRGYDEIGPKLEDWIKNDPDVFTKFLKEETDYYAVEYSGLTDSQKELLDILIQSLSIEELNTYKKLTMISKSLFGNDHKTSINIIQQYINKQN